LEDDCLPSVAFFNFIGDVYRLYRDDRSVGSISGSCLAGAVVEKGEHGFTYYPVIWGWALWRRAWHGYSLNLEGIRVNRICELESEGITDSIGTSEWLRLLQSTKENPYYTWDAQFVLQNIASRSYVVHPSRNLIKNIGFGVNATHTIHKFSRFYFLRQHAMHLKVASRSKVINKKYSRFLETEFFHDRISLRNLPYRAIRKLLLLFSK
jgi:hypothetical protein